MILHQLFGNNNVVTFGYRTKKNKTFIATRRTEALRKTNVLLLAIPTRDTTEQHEVISATNKLHVEFLVLFDEFHSKRKIKICMRIRQDFCNFSHPLVPHLRMKNATIRSFFLIEETSMKRRCGQATPSNIVRCKNFRTGK